MLRLMASSAGRLITNAECVASPTTVPTLRRTTAVTTGRLAASAARAMDARNGLSTHLPRALGPAFLVVAWILPAFGQASRVDHSKANVNGRRGVGFWPNVNDAPGDPAGYEAVLAPIDQPQSWLRFSAGKWHEVPPGVYNVLMEG